MEEENVQTEKRTLTFGERAVGITFNPGKLVQVESIKIASAILINELNDQRQKLAEGNDPDRGEAMAQFTLAIRKIQEGQMWGVKAATWLL
jgi:hypothetical protein